MNTNIDPQEISKFEALAKHWWDENGDCKPLHDINSTRLSFMQNHVDFKDKTVIDVGCGGGILTEGLAKLGAKATGIDMADSVLADSRRRVSVSVPV